MSLNDTPCKLCIFAEYEEDTQVGCSRGQIDKYREAGAKVIECYDEEKEFYVIEGRFCPFHRTEAWEKRFIAEGEEQPDFDAMERMLEFENKLGFHAIVFAGNSMPELAETLTSLSTQDHLPAQVTVVRQRTCLIPPREITDFFNFVKFPCKWRLENLWEDTVEDRAIHMVSKTVKCNYYTVSHAGYKYKPSFFSTIHSCVIDRLLQFAMLEPTKGEDGYVIPLPVHNHWHVQGDVKLTVRENIKDYQCKNPEQKMIYKLEQLMNQPTT